MSLFRRTCRPAVWLALWLVTGAGAQTLLKAGDRVVVYGDSITEQRLYSRYLQQYVYCRYPDLKVKFYNAGWGGDTAGGALGRCERDVLVLKPTVATLFFGMNDGGYRAVDKGIQDGYRRNLEGLIKLLQANNVRVVVYTPGCVDPDRNKKLGDCKYNETLAGLGAIGLELAKQYNCASADVHHPMLDCQTAQKAKDPKFTMIPDSVHPNTPGHLVMARTMLTGLGAEPMPALGSVDVATGQGDGLKVVSTNPAQTVLETTRPTPVPFWFEESAAGVVRDCGLAAFAGQKLTVKGLADGAYNLTQDGGAVGSFTSAELAAGINLTGNGSPAGKRVHDLAMRKENSYFGAWRDTRLPLADIPESKAIVDGLMAADDGFHAVIHALAAPAAKTTLVLSLMPNGPNLAKGKKYEASDPNKYNWGLGGLTDGSWEATAQHCFATGDGPDFPKTATIDLDTPAKLGTVIAGVPQFGSTRTIKVSVSLDGKEFKEVGSHEFAQRKADRWTYAFPTVEARYVRLTYADKWAGEVDYPATFAFTTEVEVYAGK